MKKVWIVVAIVVILLIAGFAYMQMGKSTAKPTEKPTTVEKPKTTQENVVTGTLKSLLSGGKTESCTITYPNNEGTGTVYVDGRRFSGEFTIKDTSGKEITGHSVSDGTYVYVWSSGNLTGIRMTLAAVNSQSSTAQKQGNLDFNRQVALKCAAWMPDGSKFTVPSNIQFMDLSNLIKPSGVPVVTGGTNTQTQTGTSPCDSITNATAKAACENALKNAGQ